MFRQSDADHKCKTSFRPFGHQNTLWRKLEMALAKRLRESPGQAIFLRGQFNQQKSHFIRLVKTCYVIWIFNLCILTTAAHCFHPKRSNKINPSDILVFLGKPDFNVRLDYEIESCITDFIIHPGWKPNAKSFDADIAIAVLAKEIPISESVYPIWVATPYNSIYSIGHLVSVHKVFSAKTLR